MKRILAPALLCLLSIQPVGGGETGSLLPRPSAAGTAEIALLREGLKADVAFVGTVVELGKSPGFWCGYFASAQRVTFRVEEVLKMPDDVRIEKGDEIAVHFFLLSGSPYCAEKPELRADVFAKGSRHLVMAHRPAFGVVTGGEEKVRLVTETCRPVEKDEKPAK